MAKAPEIAIVIYHVAPREPTILEMMILLSFFMKYGSRFAPGSNLINFQLTDMPDSVNAYWMWMHVRPWD